MATKNLAFTKNKTNVAEFSSLSKVSLDTEG